MQFTATMALVSLVEDNYFRYLAPVLREKAGGYIFFKVLKKRLLGEGHF